MINPDYLVNHFPFASRLSLKPNDSYITESGIKALTEILKNEYCFNIETLVFKNREYKIVVYLNNKARKSEYGWLREVYKFNSPIGINVEVV